MDENFAIELTDKTKDHQQWLAVMQFGLETLLKDPALLMELITREAIRECDKHQTGGRVVADDARHILTELNLRFVISS